MHEISAAPVVVPLAALAFALLLWRLHRNGTLTPLRALVALVATVYAAGLIANTLLPIYVGGVAYPAPWRLFVNLTPLANTERADMAKNVVLFAPLGLLIPLVTRLRAALPVVLSGLLVSVAMELLQLLNAVKWHGGHIADVNDVLSDTLGVILGYAVYRLLLLVPVTRRLAEAAG